MSTVHTRLGARGSKTSRIASEPYTCAKTIALTSGCPAWYWRGHTRDGGCGGAMLLGEIVGSALGVAPGESRGVGDATALTEGDGGRSACGAPWPAHAATEIIRTIHAMRTGALTSSCNACQAGWLRAQKVPFEELDGTLMDQELVLAARESMALALERDVVDRPAQRA